MADDPSAEVLIQQKLTQSGQTLSTAESCSGGLVAHRLTNVAGASAYYVGGFITYSNAAKVRQLGVSGDTLEREGAVSEAVARQMAEGCRARLESDWGIGVTGIAGPSGGTAEKPVGLVYIAVSNGRDTQITRNLFSGPREAVKGQTAEKALTMLLERLA